MNPENSKDDIEGAIYREELNSLRIEKLGNRITIISFLLPCLIGIILFFFYMDFQERVINFHHAGQSEVKAVSDNVENRINAIIVDLAKVNHRLDTELSELEKKTAGMDARLAKLSSVKADKIFVTSENKKIQKTLEILKIKIANNKRQYKKDLDIIQKTNKKRFSAIGQTDVRIEKNIEKIRTSLKTKITGIKDSLEKNFAKFESLNQKITAIEKDIKLHREQNKVLLQEKIGRKELIKRLKALKKDCDAKIAVLLYKKEQKKIKKILPGMKSKTILLHKGTESIPKGVKNSSAPRTKNADKNIKSGKIIEENLSE